MPFHARAVAQRDGERYLSAFTRASSAMVARVRSGCMVKLSAAPKASRAIEPMKGSVQLPVRSMTTPKTSGERLAASAEPLFIRPLAVPENVGANYFLRGHPVKLTGEFASVFAGTEISTTRSLKQIVGQAQVYF